MQMTASGSEGRCKVEVLHEMGVIAPRHIRITVRHDTAHEPLLCVQVKGKQRYRCKGLGSGHVLTQCIVDIWVLQHNNLYEMKVLYHCSVLTCLVSQKYNIFHVYSGGETAYTLIARNKDKGLRTKIVKKQQNN